MFVEPGIRRFQTPKKGPVKGPLGIGCQMLLVEWALPIYNSECMRVVLSQVTQGKELNGRSLLLTTYFYLFLPENP